MALFVPVIIGLPIGYFTWAKVFDTVDNSVYQIASKKQSTISSSHSDGSIADSAALAKPPNSKLAAGLGALVSVGLLSKVTFTPQTRHRLFFAQAPPNSNIRIVTLKLGIELLVRSGVVFYGGASGGAIAGRLAASSS
ncbi:secretory subunit [Mucor velutinosus]|uniref:Secretory subunit n=1 Tax=Mucor velutinosus TaxID=708070 RepID=A0AAN7DM57_9FUNG|nr:secretory subunit [Mucor velutinosus]